MIRQSNAKGLKVAHNIQDLEHGEEIILTLKDQNILDGDGELDDQDILENVDMVEKEKLEFKKILNSKSAIAEHQEKQYQQKGQRALLSKYDEITNEKEGFMINNDYEEEGVKDTQQSLEAIRMKLKTGKNQTPYQTNKVNHNIVAREYEELTDKQKEKKRKGFQKRQQKDKKKKKESIAQFLEENLEDEEHIENHGNRDEQTAKKRREQLNDNLKDKKQKINNYEAAVDNANFQSKQAQRRWQDEEDEIEQQLRQSIEQQRKLKERQQQTAKVEDNVQEFLKDNEEKEKEIQLKKQQEQEAQQKIQAPKPRQKGQKQQVDYIKELSSNQDFLKRVDTDEQFKYTEKMERMQQSSLEQQKQGTTSVVQISLPSERQVGRFKKQEELDAQIPDMLKELTKEELDELKKETEILHEEDLGTGLSGALKKLREKGFLMDSTYDYRGRALDEKPHQEKVNKSEDRINLEYRDESGREMTRKQAFRYLCHIFHGKGPSKKTLEKRQRQELEREQYRQKQSQNSSILQQTFQQHQTQNNQAHMPIVFQKNIKKVVNN